MFHRCQRSVGLSLAACFIATLSAQAIGADDGPGIQVGQQAPAFVLKDQQGQDVSLEDLLEKGKVALVFYRSASW